MISPFYADGLVTIYHGDSREILPQIEPLSVDVVLTDPPFFMPATHYSSRTTWPRSWGDTSILASFWGQTLDLTISTLKRDGHLLTFCNGDSYPVFYPEAYRRFDAIRCLVWDKGRIGMGSPWRNQHELVMAARWVGAYRSDHKGCPDVLKFPVVSSGDRLHPVDKPTALLAELLKPITQPSSVVLDPFMGGGSTLLAASSLGLPAVGIETEERYCEVVASRLAKRRPEEAPCSIA